jgi:hypothetical protein
MLAYGVVKALLGDPGSFYETAPRATETVTTLLILHTFASGCTALTGIERSAMGCLPLKPLKRTMPGRR